MADQQSTGGGFQAVVRPQAYPNRRLAHIGAAQKTVRNMEIAAERAARNLQGAEEHLTRVEADLDAARARLAELTAAEE